ncbi:MAG: hypothetical protein MZV65_44890 [Chromatiales bacterium]|nr:hypothetical protein [Chromatiales bacterium]
MVGNLPLAGAVGDCVRDAHQHHHQRAGTAALARDRAADLALRVDKRVLPFHFLEHAAAGQCRHDRNQRQRAPEPGTRLAGAPMPLDHCVSPAS